MEVFFIKNNNPVENNITNTPLTNKSTKNLKTFFPFLNAFLISSQRKYIIVSKEPPIKYILLLFQLSSNQTSFKCKNKYVIKTTLTPLVKKLIIFSQLFHVDINGIQKFSLVNGYKRGTHCFVKKSATM